MPDMMPTSLLAAVASRIGKNHYKNLFLKEEKNLLKGAGHLTGFQVLCWNGQLEFVIKKSLFFAIRCKKNKF